MPLYIFVLKIETKKSPSLMVCRAKSGELGADPKRKSKWMEPIDGFRKKGKCFPSKKNVNSSWNPLTSGYLAGS